VDTVNSDRVLIDEKIELSSKKYIVSKTDLKGIITYGNDYFVEISGYSEAELIGQPHNIIRHPDMPKAVFKLVWDSIKVGQPILGIVKNLAKDGRYYWVLAEIESRVDPATSEIVGYVAYRRAAPRSAIEKIEPLYKKLLEIEEISGMSASEKYLKGYLEEKNMTYEQFMNSMIENKGVFKKFFGRMKRIFG